MTYATARTQLACIFDKADMRSQPALMRALTRLAGQLRVRD